MTQMTKLEASTILNNGVPPKEDRMMDLTKLYWEQPGHIAPYTHLDGNYTREELLAILRFHPEEK